VAPGANAEDVAKYRAQAEHRVKAFASFVNIAGMSEHQVNAMIASSSAGKATARTLLCDPKLVGESRTAPRARVPRFNEDHARAVVGGFTSCRAAPGHIAAGDQAMIMDGTKKGLSNTAIPRVFQDEASVKVKSNIQTQVTLIYSQRNLTARRRAAKTLDAPRQIETLNLFTCRPVSLPFRKRLHYKDCSENNFSHVIGTVEFARWETSWTLDFKQKKQLFGTTTSPSGDMATQSRQMTCRRFRPRTVTWMTRSRTHCQERTNLR